MTMSTRLRHESICKRTYQNGEEVNWTNGPRKRASRPRSGLNGEDGGTFPQPETFSAHLLARMHNHAPRTPPPQSGVAVMCNASKPCRYTISHTIHICLVFCSGNELSIAPQTQTNMAPHSNRTDSFNTADSNSRPKLAKLTPPRNVDWIDQVEWDASLQPKGYDIQGTHPDSKILFLNVNILDSTGREPYLGDVLVEGQSRLCCHIGNHI